MLTPRRMFRILSVVCLLYACARVTVLGLSVCVCFPYSGTSHNQAYKQQYQRLQRDTGMKYKKGFFLKMLCSAVQTSFAYRDSPSNIKAPLSLLFQRRSILTLFKRLTVGYALPGTPLDHAESQSSLAKPKLA